MSPENSEFPSHLTFAAETDARARTRRDFSFHFQDESSSARPDNCPDRIVWPVVILRGNGDVCIMKTSLVSGAVPKLEGPLPIYPPADDNYGVDACSILVMQTVPNIVIVATSSGTVYHSVLLRTPRDEVPVKRGFIRASAHPR